jgi:hypothetical protein
MLGYRNDAQRFFDPNPLIENRFELNAVPTFWMTPAQIAEAIGIQPTHSSGIQIGNWARKKGLRAAKSNGRRLILMPPLRADRAAAAINGQ